MSGSHFFEQKSADAIVIKNLLKEIRNLREGKASMQLFKNSDGEVVIIEQWSPLQRDQLVEAINAARGVLESAEQDLVQYDGLINPQPTQQTPATTPEVTNEPLEVTVNGEAVATNPDGTLVIDTTPEPPTEQPAVQEPTPIVLQ